MATEGSNDILWVEVDGIDSDPDPCTYTHACHWN